MHSRQIGSVVEVHGFHVKVELDPAHRSPVRASMDGVDTLVRINAYLTFDLGAGDSVLGVITDLSAREVFEPANEELTLELARPRRVATTQLLGTIRARGRDVYVFDPGVNMLPTLDTPAIPARPEILKAVLEDAPKRNCPSDVTDSTVVFDGRLKMGSATGAQERLVYGSYNDVLSRPLAVVGNTGSGKSCSIAHIIQQATQIHVPPSDRPRFFILDINGEYSAAFGKALPKQGRQPNRIYINGVEASIPLWLMNAHEVCQWLSASEQAQQPALVNLWALAKGAQVTEKKGDVDVLQALGQLTAFMNVLGDDNGRKKGSSCKECWEAVKQYAPWVTQADGSKQHASTLDQILGRVTAGAWEPYDRSFGADDKKVRDAATSIMTLAEARLGGTAATVEQTADLPVYFPIGKLDNPANLDAAAELTPGDRSFRQFLQGLQLRIQNRRNDRRWQAFYNYEQQSLKSVASWFKSLGIGPDKSDMVQVIDCSMLAHDVLPYACGIIGRMLLELREQVSATARFHEPWAIVLEEAHNYVRPRRQDETRGISVSRDTFERIAKEGRKFGLSLIVASQRPSDVSPTVLSQCANFIVHRLQNPDDIEHFRKIVPTQSRRLMDQITILRAGEAVVVGSAFNVPSRVQISMPTPRPSSESSSPFLAWQTTAAAFDLAAALKTWGVTEAAG